jgi:hypothetical protein
VALYHPRHPLLGVISFFEHSLILQLGGPDVKQARRNAQTLRVGSMVGGE